MPTATSASIRASARPSAIPATASAAASPRNSASTFRRVKPSARSVPISCLRATTEIVTVL